MAIREDMKLRVFYVVAECAFFLAMIFALIEDNRAAKEEGKITFAGSVRRGEQFEKELPNGLIFYLKPTHSFFYDLDDAGWLIEVGSISDPNGSFASDVTFPFRGINTLQIEGWHFRNADNTGPNDDGSVNAPQHNRGFWFVEEGGDVNLDTPARYGFLSITELELGNLEPGSKAWIEYMEFEVNLNFEVLCSGLPRECSGTDSNE